MNTMLRECARVCTACSCALKDCQYQQLKELGEMQADMDPAQSGWFKALKGAGPLPEDFTPCCLLIYLCYYAYFEESCLSVSEHARKQLSAIVNGQ